MLSQFIKIDIQKFKANIKDDSITKSFRSTALLNGYVEKICKKLNTTEANFFKTFITDIYEQLFEINEINK